MILYMKVTNDKYQLPIAVTNTVRELAQICNTTPNAISAAISKQRAGKSKTSSFYKVEVEDE